MSEVIEFPYLPDHDMHRNPGQRVAGVGLNEQVVPQLWVVYRCPNPLCKGAVKLDAYQGPPRCTIHNLFLEPVNLGVEHQRYNAQRVDANPASQGRPQ